MTWLDAAVEYLPRWLEHQMRVTEQPGCVIAVAHKGKLVFEAAFGHADLTRGIGLTPRHRFRVASHSKTFTAAAVMKLREQRKLRLDDPVGRHVSGLRSDVAALTLAQLASHSAGLVRDGTDARQWSLQREFLNEAALRADLAQPPTLDANARFKYSNHGYGLLGLAIEQITGEPYVDWVAREIVAAAGLEETAPDVQALPVRAKLAAGHSAKHPLGKRVAIDVGMSTHALASATGFVSTAADLARFYASLAPDARTSVLSAASRREMTRRQWRSEHDSTARWYGLGLIAGTTSAWDHVGHSGGFPGVITRTACVPAQQLAVSVLTNAADGLSHQWLDGALHVLQAFEKHGAPSRRTARWSGRFWNLWGAFDLLPMAGSRVLLANPGLANPVLDASQIEVTGTDRGHVALGGGFANHGEPVRIERDARGRIRRLWHGGAPLATEAAAAKALVTLPQHNMKKSLRQV
jgi:D-alanyl-D-alanine carboxypeptidase